jgi:hypothetical protein
MVPHTSLHLDIIVVVSVDSQTQLFSLSTLGMLSDISVVGEVSDWWFILLGILLVDVIVILLARHFPQVLGKNLNIWYDKFGLEAVLADVLIIAIGFAIARYVYTWFLAPSIGWNPLWFVGLLLVIQLIHDVLFYVGVILPIPRGLNEMMDVFKDYSKAGAKILAGDAAMMVGSAILAMWLKSAPPDVTASIGLLTVYTLPYSLYTKPTF